MAKNLRGGYVPDLDENPHRHGLILKRPIGVCASIIPWNFPLSLMGNKLAPALIAGNSMVVKPAQTTPFTSTRVIRLLHEAGVPANVVNTVLGVESTCVATCGISDPVTGTEKLAIFFAPAGITDDGAVASAIRRRVTARLGICPGYVVAMSRDRFPKTTSGKIQRTRLKQALEAGKPPAK